MRYWVILMCSLFFLPSFAQEEEGSEIKKWIERLGSENVLERGEAKEKLRAYGEAAVGELKKVAEGPDPEVGARAKWLLNAAKIERTIPPNL